MFNHVVFTLTVKLVAVDDVYVLSNHGVFTLPPNVPLEPTFNVLEPDITILPLNVLFPVNVSVHDLHAAPN